MSAPHAIAIVCLAGALWCAGYVTGNPNTQEKAQAFWLGLGLFGLAAAFASV